MAKDVFEISIGSNKVEQQIKKPLPQTNADCHQI